MTKKEQGPEKASPSTLSLPELRTRIDQVDKKLIALLSERARIVEQIGEYKRGSGTPIYAPHRERQVIQKVLKHNEGPLSDRTIEAIYRELMSGSFSLELPLRIGFLGPEGSFSHIAATRHFGSSVEFANLHAIANVFEEVGARRCNYGLVPYENSVHGGVTDTMDAFLQNNTAVVYAEALIRIDHALLTNSAPTKVKRIYSKPQIFGQCRQWLAKQYPHAELIPVASSSAAAQRAAQEEGSAAIGSTLASKLYNIRALFEGIQDHPNNVTRFLILGTEEAEPSDADKTTMMFSTADHPGALADVLSVFRDANLNLTHIDKRPSLSGQWEYTFFVDCEHHHTHPRLRSAIHKIRTLVSSLRILGSYPKAQQTL